MINRKDNSVILRTADPSSGDQYIDQDNRHFRVLMVDEKSLGGAIESKSSFSQGAPALLPSGGDSGPE